MTLESLARTIAKARHGTDAMWANYMGAAEAAWREVAEECALTARTYGAEVADQDNGDREGYWLNVAAEDIARAISPDGAR